MRTSCHPITKTLNGASSGFRPNTWSGPRLETVGWRGPARTIAALILLWFGSSLHATSLSAAESPKRGGGTLRLARISDPVTLDPLGVTISSDFLLIPLLHQALLDVKDLTNVVPYAAREWSASTDKKLYTFRLRPGVKFSNGREVVAADYVFTLERLMNPTNGYCMLSSLQVIHGADDFGKGRAKHVTGLGAPTPDTLTIALDRPDPIFQYQLASTAGIALPEEDLARLGSKFSAKPIGTGPYVVQEWKRGARLRLTRNPHYQGTEPQHLDGVDLLIGGDETTHLMMFERGELDMINSIPFPSLGRLTNDPRWRSQIEFHDSTTSIFLCLNTEVPPFNNVLVRRAMNHAINRDRWMRVATHQASHAEGLTPKIIPGFDPSLHGYNYNPEKARELLLASRLPLPVHSTFWHSIDDNSRFIAQGVQADLKAVGIEVELNPISAAQMYDSAAIPGRVPFFASGYGPISPDPVEALSSNFDSRFIPGFNNAFYRNSEVDELLRAAAVEADLTQRYNLCRRAERIIVSDAPFVFMGYQTSFSIRQARLKGPLVDLSVDYRFDRVWIEE